MNIQAKLQTPQSNKLPPLPIGQKKQNQQQNFFKGPMNGNIQPITNRVASRHNSAQKTIKISISPVQRRKSFEIKETQIHEESKLLTHDFSTSNILKVSDQQTMPSENFDIYDENNINFLNQNLSSLNQNNLSTLIFGESNSQIYSIEDSFKQNSICKKCSDQVEDREVILPCQHLFHLQCFQDLVETQLGSRQFNGLQCQCGQGFTSKMVKKLPDNLRRILFKLQLKEIISIHKKKLFQCNCCDFFGVYKADLGKQTFCPNCEIKMEII